MSLRDAVEGLNHRHGVAPAPEVLEAALQLCPGRIALVSSFGAEAAVLLHLLAQVDPSVPVLMLDTELLFPETLTYQQQLSQHLGLTDVRRIRPEAPEPGLHLRDTTACCAERKVRPLARALAGFDAQITGRKRFQTGQRAQMERFEWAEGRLRVNPLTDWQPAEIAAYFEAHDLPRHPLVARGYPSIGCAPCTSPVAQGESARAGRWRGEDREECGIHFAEDGRVHRAPVPAAADTDTRKAG